MARVLILNNRFGPTAVGGAERIVEQQVHERSGNGDVVIVLSTEQYHDISSLSIHEHPGEPGVYRWYPLNISSYEKLSVHAWVFRAFWHSIDCFNILAAYKLSRFIALETPDEIITHNLMGMGMMMRWAIRRHRLNLTWTHTLHDIQLLHPSGILWWGQEQSWGYYGVVARLYRAVMRRWIAPDFVVSPSQWLLTEHRRWGFFVKSRTRVDRPRIIHSIKLQRRISPMERTQELLFVGQIEPHKGILFLINALRQYSLPFTLHIIGVGSAETPLQAQTKGDSRFRWHGKKTLLEIHKFFTQCDVLIVPSICYENAPTVIIEAQQSGVPVIASRIGGIPELIDRSERLFTPNDLVDCLRALRSAFHGPSDRS